MSVVFIGGSRRLSRLNTIVRRRLDTIIERNHGVLIGDANGGDRAVQRYLAERGHRSVTVYCMDNACRNNVGQWPLRSIPSNGLRGFDRYALKDAAMAGDADCGFMLWDGQSRGTHWNIRRLLAAGKPVVVYLASDHLCHTLREEADLNELSKAQRVIRQSPSTLSGPAGQGTLFSGD